ncbi:MAG: hypothetical protein U0232_31815 [Thermomicrobiales bacterium]
MDVFSQIEGFAHYGFPRSHAAFARLAYETAYLRRHRLACFVTARLNAQPGGFYHPSVIIGDARRHGVRVLGPDLAASAYDCTIRRVAAQGAWPCALGLRYVRGLADATGRALLAARDQDGLFAGLADLCRRGHGFLTPTPSPP